MPGTLSKMSPVCIFKGKKWKKHTCLLGFPIFYKWKCKFFNVFQYIWLINRNIFFSFQNNFSIYTRYVKKSIKLTYDSSSDTLTTENIASIWSLLSTSPLIMLYSRKIAGRLAGFFIDSFFVVHRCEKQTYDISIISCWYLKRQESYFLLCYVKQVGISLYFCAEFQYM